MKTFFIKEPIFKTRTLFIGNCSWKEVVKYLKKYKIKEDENSEDGNTAGTYRFYNKNTICFRMIYTERMNKSPEDIAILVHEIFHLVVRICDWKGVPIYANGTEGECGDETAAYLTEFFVRECLKKIK
jgi:hypothetical protein